MRARSDEPERSMLAPEEHGPACAGRAAQRQSPAREPASGAAGAALIERSTGEILLGPPKSRAGRRVVGIPQAIMPVLSEHLSVFAKDEPGALIFPGVMGGPLRRGNFNRMSAWPYAVRSIGAEGLHSHDLLSTSCPAVRGYGISWRGWATTANVRR
jgi:hypothetical protein